ncbi:hypothetical protein V493_04382, partial [Pseudogymnoascus sp. VKM F-4281 (FW-2241)]
MYNPARSSAPSINYGKYNDLHDLPGIRDAHPAPPPRPADRAPPPVVTHYKVVPPEIPRSDPREGGHSRRATFDSNPRPIIVTADARYPVAQGGGPPSPVHENYRSSQENDVYTIPSSSTRRGDYRRGQYNMSVDNADMSGSLDRESGKDRLMRVGSGREGAIYPRSRPIHSDTLVRVPDNVADYGDNDYGYTNPRDLVQYDLDVDRAPRRHPRRESYEASRSSRPSSISSYGDITRSYEPRDRERERERERERGPPPSSRGFDKIPQRGPVYDVGGMHMPMPHDHISSLAPPYASESLERRSSTRRPVSVYNEEPERRKYAADAYAMSDDEMRDRRPRRTDTFDGGIETRGFGIRADVPPVPAAPVLERGERSDKYEYDEKYDYDKDERGNRDEMEYERRHGHDERKHGKEAAAAGLSVAAAALGLGAMKGGREEEREKEEREETRERRRGRDSDEERRRRREKEAEPVDLGSRVHGERRRERDSDEERRRHREKEDEAFTLSGRDHGERRRERDSDEERRRRRETKEEDPVVDLTGRDPVERMPPRPEKVARDDSDAESRRRREEKPYREDIDKEYRRRDEKEPSSDKDQQPPVIDLNGRNPVEKPIYKEDITNREPVIEVPERRKHHHHSPSPPTSRHDSRVSPPTIDTFTPRTRKDRIRTDESNVSSPTTFNAKDAMDLRALREALNNKEPSPPPIPPKEPLRDGERERDRPSRESTDVPPRDSARNRDSDRSSRESSDLPVRDAARPRD